MAAGPQEKTIARHIAKLGAQNQRKDVKSSNEKLREWAKDHPCEADWLWSMVEKGQVSYLMGQNVNKNSSRQILRRCCFYERIPVSDQAEVLRMLDCMPADEWKRMKQRDKAINR